MHHKSMIKKEHEYAGVSTMENKVAHNLDEGLIVVCVFFYVH